MPNWCDNSLRLHHEDKTKIDALEAELSKKNDQGHSMGCLFNHLRPESPECENGDGWYAWHCENWGTKWEASLIDWCRDDDNDITVYFDTAWCPPIALYEYLDENGWEIDALYHEGGCAFAGTYISGCGDDYYEYDVSDEESIQSLPQDIIEFAGLEDAHQRWVEEQMEEKNSKSRTN